MGEVLKRIFSTIVLGVCFLGSAPTYSFESGPRENYEDLEPVDISIQDVISSDAVLSICDQMSFKRENIDLNCFDQTDRQTFQRCRERQNLSYRYVESEEKNFMCINNQTANSIKILNKYISEKQCFKDRVDAVMEVVKSDDYQNLSREFVDIFKGRFKLHFSYQPGGDVGNLNIDLTDLEEGLIREEEKTIPLMMTSLNKKGCGEIDQTIVINMIREKVEALSAKLNLRLAQRTFTYGENSQPEKYIDDSSRGAQSLGEPIGTAFDVENFKPIEEKAESNPFR